MVAAAPEVVWELLTSFDRWPAWNPDFTSVSLSGPAAVGSTFRWGDDPVMITSTIQRFEPPRRFAWTTKTLGFTVLNDWMVATGHGKTVLISGVVRRAHGRMFRRLLRKSVDRWLGEGLRHLKAEAERRTTTLTVVVHEAATA